MPKYDDFSTRMKLYEGMEAQRRLMPKLPALARLDGKCFHRFCYGLNEPFDPRLSSLMVLLASYMAEETNACAAYTQSDEITLAWYWPEINQEMIFGGRVQKMTSLLAAMAAVWFNRHLADWIPEKQQELPIFDCRVWSLPNLTEAANAFLWREQDATKNSISMAARTYFSHKEIMNLSGPQMQEMLFSRQGINWNDYPNYFKRGTFIVRRTEVREEVERRTYVRCSDLPRFSTVSNREGFLFNGEDPVLFA